MPGQGVDGLCVVIVPTYNRARTLPRALDSLVAQTDPHWVCCVLDDGSTDDTASVVRSYEERDARIQYSRFNDNRGGVVMNEVGMALAVGTGAFWVRLGSDDWFEPEKLELDRVALAHAGVCFGPYQNNPPSVPGEGNYPHDARARLLSGAFTASWANIAIRTWVLRAVRDRHGSFCDPRLRNMEDWLLNSRAARFSEFVWRGMSASGDQVLVGETDPAQVLFTVKPDAHYTIAGDGATQRPEWQHYVKADMDLTEHINRGERALYRPDDRPDPGRTYSVRERPRVGHVPHLLADGVE